MTTFYHDRGTKTSYNKEKTAKIQEKYRRKYDFPVDAKGCICYISQAKIRFRSFFYAQNPAKRLEEFKMRTRITLACTECKQRNYNTTKDKKTHPDRMETKKYCRFCKTHTLHKETK